MKDSVRQRMAVSVAVLALALCAQHLGASHSRTRLLENSSPSLVPGERLILEMRGGDLHWTMRYPGPDKRLHTVDDVCTKGPFHLPGGVAVTLQMSSGDYLYSIFLPSLQLRQMAVPDLQFELEIPPLRQESLEFVGDQFCGGSHRRLSGRFIVEPAEDFRRWVSSCEPR